MADWIPPKLRRILAETSELQRAYLVGGCVRDWLREEPNTDFDIEVFGVSFERLVAALSRWGRCDLVGRSFGVAKLTVAPGETYDFTIPRRDSKVAAGHKGFEITFDPDLTLPEAAARRDFTINALMYDPRTNELLDFFGGAEHLRRRILRHTSDAFTEDPLRVLRGMQFVARFDLTPAAETLALSRSVKHSYHELAKERVWDEWAKWAAKSRSPGRGLRFLLETGWIEHYPELQALDGTEQDPSWHPEGDVFVHTCHCCDQLVQLPAWSKADEASRIVYSLAILSHDFGKPLTTSRALRHGQMRVVSPGHEEAGVPVTATFLERIHAPHALRDRILPLVANHLAHLNEITDRAVRRLACRLQPETIASLCVVMVADHFGRPPLPRTIPGSILQLQAKAAELHLREQAPKPFVLGRHLLAAGMKPGPAIGRVLEATFDAQLEGKFADLNGGRQWLSEQPFDELDPEVRSRLLTPE